MPPGWPRNAWIEPDRPPSASLELQLEAERSLMRLQRGAELGVIVEIEPRCVAQAERSGRAGVRAVPALADALYGDALGRG